MAMSVYLKRIVLSLLIVTLVGGAGEALAQDSTPTSSRNIEDIRAWLSWELGPTTPDDGSMAFSLNYARSSHLFGTRYLVSELFDDPRSEIGLLYGRPVGWDWGQVSVSTGVAILWSRESGRWGENSSGSVQWTTVGLPLQATLYVTIPYRPIDWLGLKVGGHGNINPEESFAGATVGIVIGKLR